MTTQKKEQYATFSFDFCFDRAAADWRNQKMTATDAIQCVALVRFKLTAMGIRGNYIKKIILSVRRTRPMHMGQLEQRCSIGSLVH